jgi:hypothetical protein
MNLQHCICLSAICGNLLLMSSCGNVSDKAKTDVPEKKEKEIVKNTFDTQQFIGEYVGNFGDGHIVITISYIQGKNASGYNLHKGLRRNIKGTVTEENGKYRFRMEEPGDNKYDGVFNFWLNPTDFKGKGIWTPNDKKQLKERSFELAKRERKTEEENPFLGYWDGDCILEINPDGLAFLTYYDDSNKREYEQPDFIKIKGQWIVQGETITIEWPKNSYNGGRKYVLKIRNDDELDVSVLTDGKELSFYRY